MPLRRRFMPRRPIPSPPPPMPDFLPRRESELARWCHRFAQGLLAHGTSLGLPQDRIDAFIDLHQRFTAAYALANSGAGRSPSNLQTKETRKAALLPELRAIAAWLRASPEATDPQLSRLGLSRRKQRRRGPVPPPAMPPGVSILHADSTTLRLRLSDRQRPESRGKPPGVMSARVFVHVGPGVPLSIKDWRMQFHSSRTLRTFILPPGIAPGDTLWVTAGWVRNAATLQDGFHVGEPVCRILGRGQMYSDLQPAFATFRRAA